MIMLIYYDFQKENGKGADRAANNCRLVGSFVVRKQQNQGFPRRGIF